MHADFLSENLKGGDHSENLGKDKRLILEQVLGWEGVDWIHVAQDENL
jgi:hypothetical protein